MSPHFNNSTAMFPNIGFGLLATETDIRTECLLEPASLSVFYKNLRQRLSGSAKTTEKTIWWPSGDSIDWHDDQYKTSLLMADEVKNLGILASKSESISLASDPNGFVWILTQAGSGLLGQRSFSDSHMLPLDTNNSSIKGSSAATNTSEDCATKNHNARLQLCDDYAMLQRTYLKDHSCDAINGIGINFSIKSQIETVFKNRDNNPGNNSLETPVFNDMVDTSWGNIGVVNDSTQKTFNVYLGLGFADSDKSATIHQANACFTDWMAKIQNDDSMASEYQTNIDAFWREHRDSCYLENELWSAYEHDIWSKPEEIQERYNLPMRGTTILQPLFQLNSFFELQGR